MRRKLYISRLTFAFGAFYLFVVPQTFSQPGGSVAKPPATRESTETKPTDSRNVSIVLKSGDTLKGKFVGSTPRAIQISIADNTLSLKWEDIVQITFPQTVSESSVPRGNLSSEAVESAVRSLRKLAAATEVGVNFQDYGRRVIDIKAEVDDYLLGISDGPQKNEIVLAMQAYADAANAWNSMIRYDFMLVEFEPGKSLQARYSIPVDRSVGSPTLRRQVVLSTIWAAARKHVENASKPTATETPVNAPNTSGAILSDPSSKDVSASIVGRWSVAIKALNETDTTIFSFSKLNDGTYSGMTSSTQGTTQFENLAILGNRFSFTGKDSANGVVFSFRCEGEILGDTLIGTIRFVTPNGQSVSGTLSGVRMSP